MKNENKTNKPKRQLAGVKFAYKVGLPFICPQLNLETQTCKQTKEKLTNTLLCNLDTDTNIDYRLCESFSKWFWEEAKKQEIVKIQAENTAIENPPT